MSQGATGAVPAPLHPQERDRLAALMGYDVLDTLPEAAFDDIVFLASVICETPIALISLVDDEPAVVQGPGRNATSKRRAGEVGVLRPRHPPARGHPRRPRRAAKTRASPTNPLVTDSPAIRFYAGVPLNNPQGLPLGTLCTMDSVPRSLTAEQGSGSRRPLPRGHGPPGAAPEWVALLAGQLAATRIFRSGGSAARLEAAGRAGRPAPAPWWPRPWSRCWRPRAGCGTSSTGSRASRSRPRPLPADVKCRLRRTSGPTSTPPMPSSRRSEPTPGRASSTRSAVERRHASRRIPARAREGPSRWRGPVPPTPRRPGHGP